MARDYQYVGTELELFRLATNWKKYLRKQIQPYIKGDVLEVGAGIGGTTRTLFKPESTSWTCLEPDRNLAEALQRVVDQLAAAQSAEMQTVIGTTNDLRKGDTRFDTILYIDVMEHIEDDRGEAAVAAQLLKPGGRLIILSPAHPWLFSPFDKSIGHYRRYNRRMISRIVPDTLKKVRVRYLDSIGLLASAGNRFLLQSNMPTKKQIGLWDKMMVPLSRLCDPCSGFCFGKSILGVWQTAERDAES